MAGFGERSGIALQTRVTVCANQGDGHTNYSPSNAVGDTPIAASLLDRGTPRVSARYHPNSKGNATVSTRTILIVVLLLLLLGALPTWPYSTAWGYYPSGGLGLVLLVLIVLLLLGKI